jgi:thiamine kinase-like enzyme
MKTKKRTMKPKKRKIKTKKCMYKKRKMKAPKLDRTILGAGILGTGASGCVIDSISCGKLSRENGYVAKILNQDVDINIPLQNKLAEIDPDNKRFNRYYLPKDYTCEIEGITNNADIKACLQKGLQLNAANIVFQRHLVPLESSNTTKHQMTKSQYRYLRESLDILHKNKILHNDLPDNVMIDPDDNMPRIIDWDNASFIDNESFAAIDYNAFLNHYQVKK